MSQQPDAAYILLPGQGRTIDLGSFQMSVKAEAAKGTPFSLLEATEPAGFGPPLHIHHDAAEAFYVLEGEYLITIDDREVACPTGSFIYIPAGVSHGFRVGSVDSRKLNFYVPVAMVGYFDELSAATASGSPTPEALARIAERYSMEVLGPPPESYV